MPLYDIRCSRSGEVFERMIPLAFFSDPIKCGCGAVASRVISTPLFTVDATEYDCPVTGSRIGSKRQHEENLKRHGCRVLEAGETESAAKRRERDDLELDRKVEETVEREIESWSSDKKEQLSNELLNGQLDLAVERRTRGE
jgi:hypothetical protein